MKVMLLGLDGATWDILGPLAAEGVLPNIDRLRKTGASGELRSVFPPLSPVAWTGVMTGKNSGKHGIFEFLEHDHNPLAGRVNSSRAIRADLIWEVAAASGKKTVAGGVPMSYPPRPAKDFPGFFLGDFLSPEAAADFASDPALFDELQRVVGPYRAWSTSTHDGDGEAVVLNDLTAFLDQHLKTIEFLMGRCDWDLLMFDLMATDRFGHELWHVWDTSHPAAKGRERELEALRPKVLEFWKTLDRGLGRILDKAPADAAVLLMSDHGFGPVEHYVNFNVWLLEQGYIALKNNFYVKQKHWFYRRGVTPEWFYGLMSRWGRTGHRVSRFRGNQDGWLDRLGEKMFLSREHVDWSRTRAYAQGNFGQIFLNLKGRQPQGAVDPAEARALVDEIKQRLAEVPNPETGEPLVDRVYEPAELYHGPFADKAPDLTVVLKDWRYRTIGLHDFTTHKVVSPAFGPTGDHRMEGVLIATGAGVQPLARPHDANLLDIAPTVLHLMGVPVPADMDGRVLAELLTPELAASANQRAETTADGDGSTAAARYSADDDAEIQKRLADLGYL